MLKARLALAVFSTALEELAIWLVWRWVLPEFGVNLSVWWLVAAMAVWAAFSVTMFMFTSRVVKRQSMVGLPSMVGMRGKWASPLAPSGFVRIKGELWGAVSEGGEVGTGEEVEVVGENGLKLVVRKR
jgi:membrane-bound serine protease (ClpP class)